MKKTKKNFFLLPYSLLLLLLISWVASPVLFILERQKIRHEVKELLSWLNEDKLSVLTMSQAELDKAYYEENEIIYNGKLYDIKKIEHLANQQLRITAYCDHEETTLVNNYHDKPSSEHDSNLPEKVLSFLHLPCVVAANDYPICRNPYGSELQNYTSHNGFSPYLFVLCNLAQNIPTPPPQGQQA